MNVIGIVCEYNPMHLGHLYQIKKIKEMYPNSIIIIATNGCFTQRGDISIINKWDKTLVALENMVDLVIELPFAFACQSADIFAKGAMEIFNILGVDTLVFGSESNDLDMIKKIVKTQLCDKNYDNLVKKYLDEGYNYPTAMSKSLKDILGFTIDSPNDLLGISYVKEILRNNYNIDVVSIKRTNSYHSDYEDGEFINATLIRKYLINNKDINNYVVSNSSKYFYKNLSMDCAFNLLKYQIYVGDLKNIQTVDEGLENRIKKCINSCYSFDDLITAIKTKRYTYNKIKRMLLHILTNFTKIEANNLFIDYIRVLGFSDNGQKYLNKIKKNINIPIITHYKKNISKLLDIEYRVNCIYSFIVGDSNLIDDEFKHKPIRKKEC